MGMLIRRHRDRHKGQPEAKPKRQRNRRKAEPVAPAPEANPYNGLTDEQVAEAYATNVGGDAEGREAQVIALRAVAAFAHEFTPEG